MSKLASSARKDSLISGCASPAKPSKPTRAYLHLTRQEYLGALSDKVRNTAFYDAKGSAKDSTLLGPPSVEFAPYGRVPTSRPRKDLRQGSIDQDQEFIDFLESLTNPITKSATIDQENDSIAKSKEKVTVTPLIQFLRDKKANKGKETTSPSKSAKNTRQDSKENKSATNVDKKTLIKAANTSTPSPDKRSPQAIKVEKAARDVVRVLNKQARNTGKAVSSSPSNPLATPTPGFATTAPLAEKKRERGSASAAAKILQRDLGIGSGIGGRGGRRGGPGLANRSPASSLSPPKHDAVPSQTSKEAGPGTTSGTSNKSPNLSPSTVVLDNKPKSSFPPPTGPASSRAPVKPTPPQAANTSSSSSGSTPTKTLPTLCTATQAFLKHANPSQGITEALLEEAFAIFGVIKKVEIDKKKGFAYVDFAEPQSLHSAIKASPIKVAQGQVVVLERKTGPTLQARNMRGGSAMMGNRGGAMPMGHRGGRAAPIRRGGGIGRGAPTSVGKSVVVGLADESTPTPTSSTPATSEPSTSLGSPAT